MLIENVTVFKILLLSKYLIIASISNYHIPSIVLKSRNNTIVLPILVTDVYFPSE